MAGLLNAERNWGVNVEANKKAAAETGYTGDFAGGGFQKFMEERAKNPTLYGAPTGQTLGGATDSAGNVIPPSLGLTAEQNAQNAENGVRVTSSQFNPNDPNYVGDASKTTRNWGPADRVEINKQNARDTGYTGDFGSGGFQVYENARSGGGLLGAAKTTTTPPAAESSGGGGGNVGGGVGSPTASDTTQTKAYAGVDPRSGQAWSRANPMMQKLPDGTWRKHELPQGMTQDEFDAFMYDASPEIRAKATTAYGSLYGIKTGDDGKAVYVPINEMGGLYSTPTYSTKIIADLAKGVIPQGLGFNPQSGVTMQSLGLGNATGAVHTPVTPAPKTPETPITVNAVSGTVNNPEALNAMLRQQIGYTGSFEGNAFQQWIAQQPNATKTLYNTVIGMPRWYTGTGTTPAAQNFGANVEVNKINAAITGYPGDFGGGKFQEWLARPENAAAKAKIDAYNAAKTSTPTPTPNTNTTPTPTQTPTTPVASGNQITLGSPEVGDRSYGYNAAQAGTVNATSTNATAQQAGSEGYNAEQWKVTPEQQVEDRLNRILGSDSPLMQQAETQAKQASARRGLLNSSMAVTAGQDAMIRSALPIAQQDAQTNANAGQFNAGATNASRSFTANAGNTAALQNAQAGTQISAANAGAANTAALQNAQLGTNTNLSNAASQNTAENFNAAGRNTLQLSQMDVDSKKYLANLTADTQTKASQLDNATRVQLAGMENQNKQLIQSNATAASMNNQFVSNMLAIQQNNQMSGEAKAAAINAQIKALNNGLSTIGHIIGFDLGRYWNDPDDNVNAAGAGGNGKEAPAGSSSTDGKVYNPDTGAWE